MLRIEPNIVNPPTLLFGNSGHGDTNENFAKHLRKYGPYSNNNVRNEPHILFVFPKVERDTALKLFNAIQKGLGAFPGFNDMFKISINTKNILSIQEFNVPSNLDNQAEADFFKNHLSKYLESNHPNIDVAIQIHKKTAPFEKPSPYYACKMLLTQYGIPSQGVSIDLMSKSNFQWVVGNIALSLFVKMGGIPWVVKSDVAHTELIIGVGRAYIKTGIGIEQSIGYTMCFESNGEFKELQVYSPKMSWTEYKNEFQTTLQGFIRNYSGVNSFVIHIPKKISKREERAIAEVAKSFKDISITILRVTAGDDYCLYDKDNRDLIPRRGLCFKLDEKEALLMYGGIEENGSFSCKMLTPYHIRKELSTSPLEFDHYVKQAYHLGYMNWRGFNAQSHPITIQYSRLIANLVGNLLTIDNTLSIKEDLNKRLWFI